MIQIPRKLLYLEELTLIQRALLPIIIDHSMGWWSQNKLGIDVDSVAKLLNVSITHINPELDKLIEMRILQRERIKNGSINIYFYKINHSLIESLENRTTNIDTMAIAVDSNLFIDISHEKYIELKTFAITSLDNFNLPSSVFDDFELDCRNYNISSQDWCGEFMKWLRKKIPSSSLVASKSKFKESLDEYKPPREVIEITKYFISKLKAIDPQFIEPFNVLEWAKHVNNLLTINGYTMQDIEQSINWLFSEKGNWYRPNVKNTEDLNKKFSYIISHVRSYRDGESKLPANIDLFELIRNRNKES